MTRKQKETLKKACKDLEALQSSADQEHAHCEADKILLWALRDLGFPIIADRFREVQESVGGFWYS